MFFAYTKTYMQQYRGDDKERGSQQLHSDITETPSIIGTDIISKDKCISKVIESTKIKLVEL